MTALKRGKSGTRSLNKILAISGTPVNAVASQGTLTLAATVTAEDSMQIGNRAYTFKADGTAADPGDIDLGADLAATKLAVVAAIKGSDGINSANQLVDCEAAFTVNDLVLTAKKANSDGDLIATTSDFSSGSNLFDGLTLGTTTAGVTGTPGMAGSMMFDDTNIYISLSAGGNDNAGWKEIAHGDLT